MTEALAVPAGTAGSVSSMMVTAARPPHRTAFDELLSELNPLQYIPVVGTIYRSMTGDTIPDDARTVGSLVVSGLTGGPAGVAINLAALAVEKVIGIDPEAIGQSVLADIGIGGAKAKPPAAAAKPAAAVAAVPAAKSMKPTVTDAPWSAAQLAAYGVTIGAGGTLKRGNLEGSDVLNDLELARLAPAVAAAGTQPQQAAATSG